MEYGAIVAIIVGLSEVFKRIGLRVELIPLINVISGILINLSISGISAESAIYGVIIGLVASGIYDQSKIYEIFKKDK